jgi:MFS transporter, DHA2 family, multidrug resistance protein
MSAAALPEAEWRPKHNQWAIALTVTLATFMEVLDTSIANVALPHIAGSLSASQDESTWVLTSYLVSNAIVLPISAWLATTLGRKRFYMMCVILFGCSSFLCGLVPNLGMLVFFRILQGAGGGGLAPSEQAILADTFSAAKRGMAFAVYINVPVAILSLFLTSRLVEDPPYLKKEREKIRGVGVDYVGLGLIALGIACLQIVLDKGQEEDWFASPWITITLFVAAVLLISWVIWEWRHPAPIVDVKLFRSRNFATAMFFTFVLGIVLFGTTVVIPQFLQTLLGYPAVKAGEALAGGGFIMLLMMPIAGALVTRMDPRVMMACGFAGIAISLNYMATHLTLGMDFETAFLLRTFQTIGLPFIFLPSNTLAYLGVPREKNNQVSGMNAFVRNIGGSIGIALITTFLTRQAQKHQSLLASHTAPGSPAFDRLAGALTSRIQQSGASLPDATHQAYGRVYAILQAQSTTLAYIDVVRVLTLVIVILIPLVFIMRRPKAAPTTETMAVH